MENELNKITAVEWLIRELEKEGVRYFKLSEQAKAMEREQIMEAHYAPKYGCFSEQYYEQTYGGNN
jgi:hypothetical protein